MNRIVAGVDEVGRGCLAGPVVAAAVVLPTEHHDWIEEIKDSKKIAPKKRERLANLICEHSTWAIREASAHVIDDMNILRASLHVMRLCVECLQQQGCEPELVLVDGNYPIPGVDLPQEALKGGDNLHKAIGAASIIAKVYRDKFMTSVADLHPEYGFEKNKGYGTEAHREAIMVHGVSPIHRRTFRGVREYVIEGPRFIPYDSI